MELDSENLTRLQEIARALDELSKTKAMLSAQSAIIAALQVVREAQRPMSGGSDVDLTVIAQRVRRLLMDSGHLLFAEAERDQTKVRVALRGPKGPATSPVPGRSINAESDEAKTRADVARLWAIIQKSTLPKPPNLATR